MPNILLTNICDQKCPYCFADKELKKKETEMPFENFKLVLDFFKKSNEEIIRLMGGEPTLHSQFKKVVDYVISQNLKVHIFTNGIFSLDIAKFLSKKKEKIKYSFNINPPNTYSSRAWKQVSENLELLTPFKNSLIGNVIWQKDFNIDYLIDLTDKYPLRAILLRIANPIIGQNNKHIFLNQYSDLAKNLIKEIKKTDKNKIRIGFGCGFPKKMFSQKQHYVLKEHEVINKGWGCDGNSGRFDIGADLSVFRCFPLCNWKIKKLSDFKNIKEVEDYFTKLVEEYQLNNSNKDFIHQGPCFSYLLSQDEEYK